MPPSTNSGLNCVICTRGSQRLIAVTAQAASCNNNVWLIGGLLALGLSCHIHAAECASQQALAKYRQWIV